MGSADDAWRQKDRKATSFYPGREYLYARLRALDTKQYEISGLNSFTWTTDPVGQRFRMTARVCLMETLAVGARELSYVDNMSRRPNKRNAVNMPDCEASVETL